MLNISSNDNGNPVLGVALIDTGVDGIRESSQILLARRSPNETIHPSMLSTLTMRTSHVGISDLSVIDRELSHRQSPTWKIGDKVMTNTQRAVERLLEIKLGGLERYIGLIARTRFAFLETAIPVGSNELLTMYSIFLSLTGNSLDIPRETQHYYEIGYRNVGSYIKGEGELGEQLCDGLCNITAKKGLAVELSL